MVDICITCIFRESQNARGSVEIREYLEKNLIKKIALLLNYLVVKNMYFPRGLYRELISMDFDFMSEKLQK